jgi:hypothetical protein
MKRILVLCVALAGCGGKSDDCSKLVDRMMPIMKEMMGKDADKMDMGKSAFLEECRKNDKMKNDPVMKCVLDAKDDAAAKSCLEGGFNAYKKKGKATEADLHLNAIGKYAKLTFGETGKFPIGTAKTLPMRNNEALGGGCCGSMSSGSGVDGKCPVSTEWASDPVWKALSFTIDEPSLYRYSYTSTDGKSFVATAAGDADCDGKEAIFTLKGSLDAGGNPTVELTKPPQGEY